MPLLPAFGEAQSTQYQRAERELDDNDERDIENAKLKYVVGEQGKIDICFSIDELISFVFFFLVTLQQKLGEGIVEPRSLEDEGIFVGRKPLVPMNVVNRAEKRILQECDREKKVTVAHKIELK